MEDLVKWHKSLIIVLKLGFDLEKNSAGDLLNVVDEVYNSFESYENIMNSSQES